MSFLIRAIDIKTGHEVPGTSKDVPTAVDAIDHIRQLKTEYQEFDQFTVRVLMRGSTLPKDFEDLKGRAEDEGFSFDPTDD